LEGNRLLAEDVTSGEREEIEFRAA